VAGSAREVGAVAVQDFVDQLPLGPVDCLGHLPRIEPFAGVSDEDGARALVWL
jgi:hypothetical protein